MPFIATSNKPDASDAINRFADGTDKWLVAVKMVSEGVDIPRLRVLVYATVVKSELFVRQAVGRIVRTIDDIEDQSAYFYIPADPDLVAIVEDIKSEIDHQFDAEYEWIEREYADGGDRAEFSFIPLSSSAVADGVIFDSEHITQDEIEEARRLAVQCGYPKTCPVEPLARVIRREKQSPPTVQTTATAVLDPSPAIPLHKAKKKESKEVNHLVMKLCGVSKKAGRPLEPQEVYNWLADRVGAYQKECTLEQLKERRELLLKRIAEYTNGR